MGHRDTKTPVTRDSLCLFFHLISVVPLSGSVQPWLCLNYFWHVCVDVHMCIQEGVGTSVHIHTESRD